MQTVRKLEDKQEILSVAIDCINNLLEADTVELLCHAGVLDFLMTGLSRYEFDADLSLKIVSLLMNLTLSGQNVSELFNCGCGGGLMLLLQLMQSHASNENLVVKVIKIYFIYFNSNVFLDSWSS